MHLPPEASSTLYIEGLPTDATEREVAHVFRRYEGAGFQSVRMRPIESARNPGTSLFLCFAEFDNAHQATIALYGLQGYRFDAKAEGSSSGIRISYAKNKAARGSAPRGLPPPQHQGSYEHPKRETSALQNDGSDDWGRHGTYEDDGRNPNDHDGGSSGYRRDGREHHDRYHDEHEDSERDDDFLQRAENMPGVTDP